MHKLSFVGALTTLCLATALAGCSSADPPAGPGTTPPTARDAGPPTARDAGPRWAPDAGAVIQAETPPPPISGGTLAVSPDGALLVAADPELDTVSIVDATTPALLHTIELTPGDEPGRVAIDGSGRAHVVLRSAGAIAGVDLATGALLGRRAVCAVPRGIAWRASDDTLHVACSEGLLVSLPAAGGAPTRRVHVADDLRDVVVRGDTLYVTQLRSAHLLRLDAEGAPAADHAPSSIPSDLGRVVARITQPGEFEPAVAWRAIPTPEGVLVLHQRALSAEFVAEGGYGGAGCGGAIVHDAITEVVEGETTTVQSGAPLFDAVLAVDVALSPDGQRIAVAAPANGYTRASFTELTISRVERDVLVYRRTSAVAPGSDCVADVTYPQLAEGGVAVAVAFLPDGRLVAQTRAPARLVFERLDLGATAAEVTLSTRDTYDTGHMLFHAATGGGIACASCHPEGGDDARVWRFFEIGPRRTQTMRGGLIDTAPFHWDGDMAEFADLVHHVFEGRMGGSIFQPAEIDAFARWMDALPALPRPEVGDADAIERGRALFHDATVACATCHAGESLTNSVSVDVGTGSALQVPTLLGIAYRAPYMHDGCAPTLHDRFGTCGGGDAHGRTSHLSPAQIDDLVAYLRTL